MSKVADKSTVRNPITEEQSKAAAVPHKPLPPKMNLNRMTMAKARDSELIMQPDGHRCARVEYWLKPEHTLEDTLKSEFWSQVAYKFYRPVLAEGDYAGTIIEIRTQDLSLYAELFVRVVRKSGLEVQLLTSYEIGLQNVVAPGYEVRWSDRVCGYDIIRNSDREIVGQAKDFRTKEAAQVWLDRNA